MSTEIKFRIDNEDAFDNICGESDCNIKIIEKSLGVEINTQKPGYYNIINISGNKVEQANDILQSLKFQANFKTIKTSDVEIMIKDYTQSYVADKSDNINTRFKEVIMHSNNQQNYVKAIKTQDLIFATGPKRTGKTYLAIACAIEALNDKNSSITRIVITSPDIKHNYNNGNKIKNAYLFSIYDILYDLIGFEETTRLLNANIIEVSQSELMGERVLNNTFIIKDNYIKDNIKNVTTCMGTESKVVIIVESEYSSDFLEIMKKLNNEPEISFCYFYDYNIIERHKLVQKIIKLL
jgi:phosphate starvation-inducible PhoH-like protein